MSLRVRHLGARDLAGFRAMNVLFAEAFEAPDQYAAELPGDAYVLGWLAQPHNIAILAEHDGQPVGALAGYELAKFEQARSEIYIYDLAVAESHRRLGVATAMIEELRRIARERGAWTVFVQADIVPEDEPARALYRKLACEEITALHCDIAP